MYHDYPNFQHQRELDRGILPVLGAVTLEGRPSLTSNNAGQIDNLTFNGFGILNNFGTITEATLNGRGEEDWQLWLHSSGNAIPSLSRDKARVKLPKL